MLTIDANIDSFQSESDHDLDLRFAQIGTLNHNWTVWPKEGHLLLNGLVYNAVGSKFTKRNAFVPFIDLKQKGYWIPDASTSYGNWVLLYLWLHIIAGWILTTLWVAGFSGLVRSRN
jgi:hypothetical protein